MNTKKDKKFKELLDFLADSFSKFLKENPAIFRAMINGYKAQFEIQAVPENEREIKVACSVIAPDGKEISFKEFFEGK